MTSSIPDYIIENELRWKDLVIKSEMEKISTFTEEAKNYPTMKDSNKNRALLAYRRAEKNAWIYKTLSEKKKLVLLHFQKPKLIIYT